MERDETSSFYDGENKNFNSHAHVERDMFNSDTDKYPMHFNSHAHVERDLQNSPVIANQTISTHTLTWSVTDFNPPDDYFIRFQLTRSRGA